MNSPWTLWNKGYTLCRSCRKHVSSKPALNCEEPRHLKCYTRNVTRIAENRARAKLEALIHYSGSDPPKCVLCGYSNMVALQFDHIAGDGAEFRRKHPHKSGKSLALWLRKSEWPEGYRVLCANCQYVERNRLKNYN